MSYDMIVPEERPPVQSLRRNNLANVGVFRLETGSPLIREFRNTETNNARRTFLFNERTASLNTNFESFDERTPILSSGRPSLQSSFPQNITATVLIASGVCLWLTVVGMFVAAYWNFSSTISAARAEFRPYAAEAIQHTMQILANADAATSGAHGVMDGAQLLSDNAVPAIRHALNQSSTMIDRLERLAQNPILQISLQQGHTASATR